MQSLCKSVVYTKIHSHKTGTPGIRRSPCIKRSMQLSEYIERRSHAIGYQCANDGRNDGNPGISPVRAAFAGNRQNRMGQTRTEISGRINGISRRAAEAEADGPDKDTDNIRTYAGRHRSHRFGENHPDDKYQEERADNFAQDVGRIVADSRSRAENAQFSRFVFRFRPMRQIRQPNDGCAAHCAENLDDRRRQELFKGVNADHRLRQRNGRI